MFLPVQGSTTPSLVRATSTPTSTSRTSRPSSWWTPPRSRSPSTWGTGYDSTRYWEHVPWNCVSQDILNEPVCGAWYNTILANSSYLIGTVPILTQEKGRKKSDFIMCSYFCKNLPVVMYRKFRNVPILRDIPPICPYFLGFRVGKYAILIRDPPSLLPQIRIGRDERGRA